MHEIILINRSDNARVSGCGDFQCHRRGIDRAQSGQEIFEIEGNFNLAAFDLRLQVTRVFAGLGGLRRQCNLPWSLLRTRLDMVGADVSVIIPTRGRTDKLFVSLHHILECNPMPAEIIIHVDGDDNQTASFTRSHFPRVRLIESNERVGLAGHETD